MTHTNFTGQSPATELTIGELVKQIAEQLSVLVRDELKLAPLEMTRKGKEAGTGAGLMGGSTPPLPTEAVGSVKTDVAEIRERVRR